MLVESVPGLDLAGRSHRPELPEPGAPSPEVRETDEYVEVETDALTARIQKKGYVSGLAKGSFLDKKTGARDAGFGLHIMDFLMAPGWRDDGYPRDPVPDQQQCREVVAMRAEAGVASVAFPQLNDDTCLQYDVAKDVLRMGLSVTLAVPRLPLR